MRNILPSLLMAIIIFVAMAKEGFSMDMSPVEETIDIVDDNTKARIKSDLADNMTRVFNHNGQEQYSISEFIGARRYIISKDLKYLIFIGEYHFGKNINLGAYIGYPQNPSYIKIFENGKEVKDIKHTDLFEKTARELVDFYDLPEIGGGWISLYYLIKNINKLEGDNHIDWKNKTIFLELCDGSSRVISF